ncbi:flagellar biosynthesis protein FlhA [Hyphococcus luteus]|uniref:Flagellar biosynthesis protein FlhA n=1 Tax=Hyphococcus luteus TaxID=2058213 RepID=A0A2S7K8Q9_9PROT|nr:flagellar biosynthesis protein FlhA [Marinicaulis flavus]PQA88871.1 flagellar biosynthesis protein FlhA [Marinicaulis flavus]
MDSALKLNLPGQTTVLLAIGLMAIIVMMVLPVPSFVLDIGLTLSFALAILIFTMTLFIERPLEFSAFPTVLLASLMLRLSLNVSSTKLIIGEGHTGPDAAGKVIEGFAMFIMGGNVFLGLVVFGVLLIVNFMVITKGAGRMAEVGARFALDGMPGKQLAIDSDVASGAISHEEAKERRRIEQDETTFFGSLDGASKFVKGDAIAGLLITLLNLVVGLGMGIGAHGMTAGDAASTYSILTVGDGLVSQIPAVIISIAAALLLSKGGVAGSADKAMLAQLGTNPLALGTVAVIMAVFALMPGLPFLPFFIGAGGFATASYLIYKDQEEKKQAAQEAPPPKPKETQKQLGDVLDVDEIHVEFSGDLIPLALDNVNGLEPRIVKIRHYIAAEFGFIIPPIRLTDNLDLKANEYVVKIQGVAAARGKLYQDKVLVIVDDLANLPIPGEDCEEPVYGAPARWVDRKAREDAMALGHAVVEPAEVVSTHLLETIKQNFSRLVTRRSVQRIFDEFVKNSDTDRAASNRRLLDDFVPDKAPIEFVQSVFRLLLDERVPIRNLPVMLETIAEGRNMYNSAEEVTEFVRQRISRNFVTALQTEDGSLPLIQIGLDWESTFAEHETQSPGGGTDVALPPADFNRLAQAVVEQINQSTARQLYPAIVTSAKRRRFIRAVLHAKKIRNPVLSYEEIDTSAKPVLVGTA